MTYNVFVFCGGKCGGTTLSETFNKNDYEALHLHSFNCNGFNNPNTDITKIYDILENIIYFKHKRYYVFQQL